jgi:hypothetical protein
MSEGHAPSIFSPGNMKFGRSNLAGGLNDDGRPYPSEAKIGITSAILAGNLIGEGSLVVLFAAAANINMLSALAFLISRSRSSSSSVNPSERVIISTFQTLTACRTAY